MSRRWSWPLIVIGIALAVRLAAAVVVQRIVDADPNRVFLVRGDADGYWALAGTIVNGEPYEIHDPPRMALRMPGFPLVLAATRVVSGDSTFFARLVMAAIGAVACGLVYELGRLLVDATTGLVAAAGAAVSPLLVGFSPVLLTETVFAALLLASLVTFVRLRRRAGWGLGLVLGLAIGGGVLVKPSWVLACPLFGVAEVWFGQASRAAWLRGGLIVVGTLLTLLPWTIRNAVVTGRLVPLTLWAGPSLYDGWNPEADGSSDMTFFDRDRERGVTAGMSEFEVDRHYRREAFRFAWANPGRVCELAFVKLGRYFRPWPTASGFARWWIAVPATLFFVLLFGGAVFGLRWQRADATLLIATLGPLLYFAVLHTAFVGSLRYRLPAEYPLWVLAACAIPRARRWGGES